MGNAKRKQQAKHHKQQAAAENSSSGKLALLAIGAIFLAAGIGTFVIVSGSDETKTRVADNTQQTQPVTISGAALSSYPEDGTDDAVKKLAPTLTGKNFEGSAVAIGGKSTQPTLVLFFAHWCPHCQKELPIVQNWLSESPPKNVKVLAVSTSMNQGASNFPPSTWFARENWPTPVLADSPSNEAATAYGLSSFPYYVMLNSDGTVAERMAGERSVDELKDFLSKAK